MTALHYLTVQDMLWINLQVTKKVNHYNFARLEEATFYQYSYGESKDLVPQAGRFASGFPRLRPFDTGNAATAFVGCLAFLRLNGIYLTMLDAIAYEWFESILSKAKSGTDAIQDKAQMAEQQDHIEPNVRETIQRVLDQYSCTVLTLAQLN